MLCRFGILHSSDHLQCPLNRSSLAHNQLDQPTLWSVLLFSQALQSPPRRPPTAYHRR